MATIGKDKNGRKRILFQCPETKKRKTIRIGKASVKNAEAVKTKVEQLISCKLSNTHWPADLSGWVGSLSDEMSKKLVAVGLIPTLPTREPKGIATLEAFVEAYIERRTDVSPHTRRIWRQTKSRLVEFFGADKSLKDITVGNATDWRLMLVSLGMADASVRKHCGFAKHFFVQAVDHELIGSNPFRKLISAPVGNESRQYFVTREETQKVLEAAPDAQWRLIIALSRYGGLRCPSEHLALTWSDINWEHSRIHVTSPKTARHAGHESRITPLWPELEPYLRDAFEEAEPGVEHVITRYREGNSNIRTQMTRIVKRAGLKPWPRIFHNLRSSRQTELEETESSHVVCGWMGNSQQVARKHYLQITDEHFERALSRAAQNAAQYPAVSSSKEPKEPQREVAQDAANPLIHSVLQPNAAVCESVPDARTEVHGNRTHRPHVFHAAQRF